MKQPTSLLLDFKTRDDASEAAAQLAEAALSEAIKARGRASLAVSGGSTPGPMLQSLSNADIDWASVSVGLVDERRVTPEHDASNEGLVRRTLLRGHAASANFLTMWSADDGVVEKNYASEVPFDFILLGMGADGHTASWFPGAKNLDDAFKPDGPTIVSIDATGCPVAGAITDRLTLTYSTVASARQAVLLIFGDEKKNVLLRALTSKPLDAPIRAAVDGLGQKLTIVWAP